VNVDGIAGFHGLIRLQFSILYAHLLIYTCFISRMVFESLLLDSHPLDFIDREDERVVSTDEGAALAGAWGIPFFEVSSKTR
jgi:hypothetical protein